MKRRDPAQRIKATKGSRDEGIRVYIDAQSLRKAGIANNDSPIYYRIWAAPGGSCVVRLYSEP